MMPELPDVETMRRYLLSTALHQRIEQVRVGGEKNRKLLEGIDPQQLGKEVHGCTFEGARRHGKYLFPKLSSGKYLVIHLGMTGSLRYYKNEPDAFSHVRASFLFENGYQLAFSNPRLFGMMGMAPEPETFIRQKDLGPDALDGMDCEDLHELIRRGNTQIKALLMDQHKLAGIGNVYADEILFQARVHPFSPANLLRRREQERLSASLRKVLKEAVRVQADPGRMPKTFLIQKRKKGRRCPRCDNPLKNTSVRGRSTYFCPECQTF